MASFHITGGQVLRGTVSTPGSKNAVLPMMAASLLFEAPVTLTNVPQIRDVAVMSDLLTGLGKTVSWPDKETLTIAPAGDLASAVPADLAKRLRASVMLLGPLLARLGQVSLPHPGGDKIGKRPINLHLRALRQMGATINEQPDALYLLSGKLSGADIYLEVASVGATENILMAGALASGTTIVRHAAQEPHVTALAKMLADAGLNLSGIGTSTITIEGRAGRPITQPIEAAVPPDELDAGTFAILAVLTDGEITIDPFPRDELRPLTEKLMEIGAQFAWQEENRVTVRRDHDLTAFNLKVGYAPGFATDLQPPMGVLATQCQGESWIHDWIYEERFGYTKELQKFGAQMEMVDPHRVKVLGPTPLVATHIESLDIRAGIAFVLAALIAHGESSIDHAEIIERGYADLVKRIEGIGGKMTRVEA